MKKLSYTYKLAIFASLAAPAFLAAPAQAATFLGLYPGTDCKGGSFSSCFATQTGTNIADGELLSPVVVKYNGATQLDEISTNYASVDGSEFLINFDELTNTVSFDYTPGADDPAIHYFAIKQGNQYALYYDAAAILSGSVDLDGVNFRAGTDSFSHISFFNSGTPAVPEPSTWAMMLLGFGFVGGAMRSAKRRRKLTVSYA